MCFPPRNMPSVYEITTASHDEPGGLEKIVRGSLKSVSGGP